MQWRWSATTACCSSTLGYTPTNCRRWPTSCPNSGSGSRQGSDTPALDHLLWHELLGSAPRYGTSRCVATARLRRSDAQAKAARLAADARLDLLGDILDVPVRDGCIAWNGPAVRILEHDGHAPGHAALLINGVLVAGDMVSDVEIPLLDLNGTADPIGDYLAALDMFHEIARDVRVVVPGHGAVGTADQLLNRISQDRAYLTALSLGKNPMTHVSDHRRTTARTGCPANTGGNCSTPSNEPDCGSDQPPTR